MDAFTVYKGLVAPLDRENVDTDAIIPKQFLKSIKKTGFGQNLFDELRYLDHGEPGQDCSKRPLNSDFVLNQTRYQGAGVLLARKNFGCGSSREHAPWALSQFGFRLGLYRNLAFVPLLPPVLPTSSSITALRMAYCPSFWPNSKWITSLMRPRPSLGINSRSIWSGKRSLLLITETILLK